MPNTPAKNVSGTKKDISTVKTFMMRLILCEICEENSSARPVANSRSEARDKGRIRQPADNRNPRAAQIFFTHRFR